MASRNRTKRPAVGPVGKIFKGPSVGTPDTKLERIRQRLGGSVSDSVGRLVEVMQHMKNKNRAPDDEHYRAWEDATGLDKKTLQELWPMA